MLIICLINTGLYSNWLPLWDKSWAFYFFILTYHELLRVILCIIHLPTMGDQHIFLMGDTTQIYGGLHWLTPISIVNSVLMILLFQTMVLWPIVPSCIKDGGWWGSWSCLEVNPQDPEPAESSTILDRHNLKASVDLTLSLPIALQ